jgi:hypothetical protein
MAAHDGSHLARRKLMSRVPQWGGGGSAAAPPKVDQTKYVLSCSSIVIRAPLTRPSSSPISS